ncbi:hypothetical protein AMS68_005679 [Peltaster fructicola]|uniref:rhomboid protease n=1 Tax=Peltaster fructicola TaxID=286661 RepID=A0A6H0XZG2_9PEZI|nr:hypothetical protein AMS68_005679 [Peltaster fructicola]
MASSFALPDTRRLRNFILRLPLATRIETAILTAFYIAHIVHPGLDQWGALVPQEIRLDTLSRLNTYTLIHSSFFHFALNVIALIPLLERFEVENGTLVTLIVFNGSFSLLPGALYTVIELFVIRQNTAVVGASIWICLLLGIEAIKTYRQNPSLVIAGYDIPTWSTPIFLVLVTSFLIPHVSLLGHLCGLCIGYLWGLGVLRILAPSEKLLRWVEEKLNLLRRIPNYVSVDQKIYGRYGILPSTGGTRVGPGRGGVLNASGTPTTPNGLAGSTQRLGP